jgi:VanZ family protein
MSAPGTQAMHWRSPPARRAWALVAVWLVLIFTFSSDIFSASSTGSWVGPFLRWLFPDWTPTEIWRLHYALRKSAHPTVYGVLALLAFRALRLSSAAGAWRHAALALALVLAVASSDEYRQSLSRAPTGALRDVGWDLAGGVAALALRGAFELALRRGRAGLW